MSVRIHLISICCQTDNVYHLGEHLIGILCVLRCVIANLIQENILSNIYRLPGLIADDFKMFMGEFSSYLTAINNFNLFHFYIEVKDDL